LSVARHQAGRSHRAAPGPLARRRVALTAGAALTVGATAVGVVLAGSESPATTGSCPLGGRALQIVAAPEIAPSIAELVRTADPAPADRNGSACPRPEVRAEEPARTARALATDAVDRPDVWVPDSSMWARGLARPRAGVPPRNPSVASSPFVLAVHDPAGAASSTRPTVEDLVPGSGTPVRWTIPSPRRSASGAAALLMAERALQGRRDAAQRRTILLRGADLGAAPRLERTLGRRPTEPTAVATTEQQASAYNRAHPRRRVALAYSEDTSIAADYPFIVLAGQRSRRQAAADLLTRLHGDRGQRLLAEAGFRDRLGVPDEPLASAPGVDAAPRRPRAAQADAVRAAVRGALAVRRPSRLLAVLDVSGSMANPVPEAGGLTRLDVAVRALVTGLATYQDDTVVGLWTFSTNLTPTSDHRVLVAPVSLGTGPDGVSGRATLATALNGTTVVPYGGTGLYDTVLAAVRRARAGWDPARANSVVLVTDGANEDDHGIGLRRLLRTLRAERDRSRPVAVYAVAYGPSADHAALRRIVAVTGGTAYQALDYRDLPTVIADAIGRRGPGPRGR